VAKNRTNRYATIAGKTETKKNVPTAIRSDRFKKLYRGASQYAALAIRSIINLSMFVSIAKNKKSLLNGSEAEKKERRYATNVVKNAKRKLKNDPVII
jgi:hypothetical protein